jgi:hypothetical protein
MLLFPNIIFSLDDFSEEKMTKTRWKYILNLKNRFPELKITMYTVPLLCSEDWLKWIKNTYPWIELHYHGSDHKNKDEWLGKTFFSPSCPDVFFRGFKAPWYRMNQKTANWFNDNNYIISSKKNKFDIHAKKVYRFNDGKEILKNICYDCGKNRSINSHVQSIFNIGLPDVFDKIIKLINSKNFLFVSQLFN